MLPAILLDRRHFFRRSTPGDEGAGGDEGRENDMHDAGGDGELGIVVVEHVVHGPHDVAEAHAPCFEGRD